VNWLLCGEDLDLATGPVLASTAENDVTRDLQEATWNDTAYVLNLGH